MHLLKRVVPLPLVTLMAMSGFLAVSVVRAARSHITCSMQYRGAGQ